MTAINLSQIVSSVLLQEKGKQINLSIVLKSCNKVFQYLYKRKVNATMTLEPQIHTITKIVNKLGFKVQKSAIQPKGKNDEMEVILAARED